MSLGLMALPAAYGVWLGIRALTFPYPLDYGEGALLDQALRLAKGEDIYRIPGPVPPWTISNYPPLYPLLLSGLLHVFGPAYWYGRCVSLLGAAAAAVVIGLVVHRFSRDRAAAAVAALTFLAIPFVGLWSGFARIDTLALALSLLALLVLVARPRAAGALAVAVVLLSAAVLTRQTYLLAAPLAGFLWMYGLNRRRAFVLAAGVVTAVAGAGLLLNVVTRGGFWFNIVTANLNQVDWSSLRWYGSFLTGHLPVLVVSGMAYAAWAIRHPDRASRLVGPYLAASVVVALTVVKVGSNVNYLLELSAGLSLATGLLVARLRQYPPLKAALLALLAAQAVLLLLRTDLYDGTRSLLADRSSSLRLEQVVAEVEGPVLADQDMGFLPLTGKALVLQPFEMAELARAGAWDDAPLVTSVTEQRYGAILILHLPTFPIERQRWTPAVLSAIESSYVVADTIPRYGGFTSVYHPRPHRRT